MSTSAIKKSVPPLEDIKNPESTYITIGAHEYEVPVLTWERIQILWDTLQDIGNMPILENPTQEQIIADRATRIRKTIQIFAVAMKDDYPDMTADNIQKKLRFQEAMKLQDKFTELMTKAGLMGEAEGTESP